MQTRHLSEETIRAIVADRNTRHFDFGSKELEAWTRTHRNEHTGICYCTSSFYVVRHRSYDQQCPEHRVLSRWEYGRVVPTSFDVPQD